MNTNAGPLTSNSSQNPCLTLSVASASLLSSLTRLSISAALIRVVFRGCKGQQSEEKQIRECFQCFSSFATEQILRQVI